MRWFGAPTGGSPIGGSVPEIEGRGNVIDGSGGTMLGSVGDIEPVVDTEDCASSPAGSPTRTIVAKIRRIVLSLL